MNDSSILERYAEIFKISMAVLSKSGRTLILHHGFVRIFEEKKIYNGLAMSASVQVSSVRWLLG